MLITLTKFQAFCTLRTPFDIVFNALFNHLEKDENKEVVMSFSIPEIDSEDAERIDNFFCFIGGAWIS